MRNPSSCTGSFALQALSPQAAGKQNIFRHSCYFLSNVYYAGCVSITVVFQSAAQSIQTLARWKAAQWLCSACYVVQDRHCY